MRPPHDGSRPRPAAPRAFTPPVSNGSGATWTLFELLCV